MGLLMERLMEQPADGVEHKPAELSDGRQGKGRQPLQVGGEADEEDKVEEEVVDHHVAGHVKLGHYQPLQLAGKGRLLPPVSREEEVDGDADGQEAGGSGDHRDHRSRARKVQYKNPSGPLQTPENMH